MTSMIERVAAGLTAEFEAAGRVFDVGQAEDLARAAIAAMREPTEKMIDAGRDADNGEDRNLGERGAKEAWQLMIDAALK